MRDFKNSLDSDGDSNHKKGKVLGKRVGRPRIDKKKTFVYNSDKALAFGRKGIKNNKNI